MKLHQRIAYEIKELIIEEDLLSGDRLPSLNTLCEQYQCSKGTVLKAYDTLRSQHIVYAKPQSGYFVADDLQRQNNPLEHIYDLSTGNPTVDSFSVLEVKHCLNIAVEQYSKNSLETELRGVPSLSLSLKDFLDSKGIHTKHKNLFLTQGITQTLSILCNIDFPNNHQTILIESPTYSFFVDMLKAMRQDVVTIKRDENGIDLDELETLFKTHKIKFFYVVPRNHNPLGTVLSYAQRRKIIELAHRYDVYIVEDDYFSDAFAIAKYDPLYYYSEFKNCIYLQSFSKIMSYIRIGFAIIPDRLIAPFWEGVDLSYYSSYHMPSLVSQATLEAAIRSDILKNNMDATSVSLTKKWSIVEAVTNTWDSNIAYHLNGKSGFYSSIRLHPSIDVKQLMTNLDALDILVSSTIKSFYDEADYDNSLRVSLSRINNKHIKPTFQTLYQEINKLYLP